MANKKENLHKSKQKPVATPEDIRNLSIKYNTFNATDTPEDIYAVRNSVHEQMSQYSNVQDIYDALLHPEKYGITIDQNDPEKVLIPLDRQNVFPGYEPVYGNREGFSDTSVSGYRLKDNIIPEGTEPVNNLSYDELYTLNEAGNLYKPDFQNTYSWYTYPQNNEIVDEIVDDTQNYSPQIQIPSEVTPIYEEPTYTLDFEPEEVYEEEYYPPVVQLNDLKPINRSSLPVEDDQIQTQNAFYNTNVFNGYQEPTQDDINVFTPTVQDPAVVSSSTEPVTNDYSNFVIDPKYPFTEDAIRFMENTKYNKDPYGILRSSQPSNISDRKTVEVNQSELSNMEKELYNVFGIYWDKELNTWRVDSNQYSQPIYGEEISDPYIRSHGQSKTLKGITRYDSMPIDILFTLGDGVTDYNSIYQLYDRLLRYLKFPYIRI